MGTILATNRDTFKTLFNNTAINRTLPVSALKVNEKDIQGVCAALCEAYLLKKPKQMFRGFVPLPIISP